MIKRGEWKQNDSDLLAHFIDVVSLIGGSKWRRAPLKVGITNPAESVLPTNEMLIFVGIYFRQLFCDDQLLNHARNTYARFCDSDSRRQMAKAGYKSAVASWNAVPLAFHVYDEKVRRPAKITALPITAQLFNTFLYGAHVLHSRGR